jgi:hypothetical protein
MNLTEAERNTGTWYIDDLDSGAVLVDSSLDTSSMNPIANKPVATAIDQINSNLSKWQLLHMTYPANTDHITFTNSNRLIDGVICSLSNWYNNYGVTISNDLHQAYITVRDSDGNMPAASLDVTILLKFQ